LLYLVGKYPTIKIREKLKRPQTASKKVKGKGFPYSIPSVGPGADLGVRQSACR